MSARVPTSTRRGLYARSGSRCERCGLRAEVGLQVSHRKPKGMGGKREDWADLSQYNLLCYMCHLGFVEKFPLEAHADGYKVYRDRSTLSVPVITVWGWAYLTRDGAYAWPPVVGSGPWRRSSP